MNEVKSSQLYSFSHNFSLSHLKPERKASLSQGAKERLIFPSVQPVANSKQLVENWCILADDRGRIVSQRALTLSGAATSWQPEKLFSCRVFSPCRGWWFFRSFSSYFCHLFALFPLASVWSFFFVFRKESSNRVRALSGKASIVLRLVRWDFGGKVVEIVSECDCVKI